MSFARPPILLINLFDVHTRSHTKLGSVPPSKLQRRVTEGWNSKQCQFVFPNVQGAEHLHTYIHTYIPVLSRAQTITSFVSSSRRCSSDSSHETDYRNHAKPRTQHGLILLVPFVPSLPVFLTSNVRLYV